MLTLRQIEYVLKVAEYGRISAACKELNVAQSSVLAAMALAEKLNKIPIFIRRQGRGISVTPAGQKFLMSAKRLLSAQSDFWNSLNDEDSYKNTAIRVGCYFSLSAVLVLPIIKRMREQFGEVEFILYEGGPEQLQHWLDLGALDVVVTYAIGEEYADGATPICICPAHALVRYDNKLAKRKSILIQNLTDQKMILLDLPELRTYMMSLFDKATRQPKISIRTRSYETIRSAVANGMGFSIVNFKPSQETLLDTQNLRRIPILDAAPQAKIVILDPYGNNKPTYVKAFINVVYNYITELGEDNFAVAPPSLRGKLICPAPKF